MEAIASPMIVPVHSRAGKGTVRSNKNVSTVPLQMAMARKQRATNISKKC